MFKWITRGRRCSKNFLGIANDQQNKTQLPSRLCGHHTQQPLPRADRKGPIFYLPNH